MALVRNKRNHRSWQCQTHPVLGTPGWFFDLSGKCLALSVTRTPGITTSTSMTVTPRRRATPREISSLVHTNNTFPRSAYWNTARQRTFPIRNEILDRPASWNGLVSYVITCSYSLMIPLKSKTGIVSLLLTFQPWSLTMSSTAILAGLLVNSIPVHLGTKTGWPPRSLQLICASEYFYSL